MRLAGYRRIAVGLAMAIVWIAASQVRAQSTPPRTGPAPDASKLLPMPPTLGLQGNDDPTGTAAPSAEDARKAFNDCLSNWDRGTHMSKTEWQQACKRTLNGQYF